MMSSTLMILVSVMTIAALSGEALVALPPQCNPGYLEELPPRLRKVCVAIARIWDVRDMNDFVDDREYRENLPRYDSAVKRQDVDHVFLRFGKRQKSGKSKKEKDVTRSGLDFRRRAKDILAEIESCENDVTERITYENHRC